MEARHDRGWLIFVLLVPVIVGIVIFNAIDRALASNPICIPAYDERIHPLLVGQTMPLRLGWPDESDPDTCISDNVSDVVWSSEDTAIVSLLPDGRVRGIAPGMFRVRARHGQRNLDGTGFVMPEEWSVQITPESATIAAGETVAFDVRAHDSSGRLLPRVPFDLYTAEPLIDPSVIDERRHFGATQAVVVQGVRAGATTITGAIGMGIGSKEAAATIVVTEGGR
jgi:hypothetical protein